MFNLQPFRSRRLVWLLAAVLPFQFFPPTSCRCGMSGHPGRGVEQPLAQRGCCGRAAQSCCADTGVEGRPCCLAMLRAPNNCHGQTTGVCSCQSRRVPPASVEGHPDGREQTTDAAAPVLADVSLSVGKFKPLPSTSSLAACASGSTGSERCIMLCRFIL